MRLTVSAVMLSLAVSTPAVAIDYTCFDSGTRKRFAVRQEHPPNPLPCAVQIMEHPLGRYFYDWKEPWRAVWQEGFCGGKVHDMVKNHREQGWKCMETEVYRGTKKAPRGEEAKP